MINNNVDVEEWRRKMIRDVKNWQGTPDSNYLRGDLLEGIDEGCAMMRKVEAMSRELADATRDCGEAQLALLAVQKTLRRLGWCPDVRGVMVTIEAMHKKLEQYSEATFEKLLFIEQGRNAELQCEVRQLNNLVEHAKDLDKDCQTWSDRELKATYSSKHLPDPGILKSDRAVDFLKGFLNQEEPDEFFGAVLVILAEREVERMEKE
jgi:hypothetical protein